MAPVASTVVKPGIEGAVVASPSPAPRYGLSVVPKSPGSLASTQLTEMLAYGPRGK